MDEEEGARELVQSLDHRYNFTSDVLAALDQMRWEGDFEYPPLPCHRDNVEYTIQLNMHPERLLQQRPITLSQTYSIVRTDLPGIGPWAAGGTVLAIVLGLTKFPLLDSYGNTFGKRYLFKGCLRGEGIYKEVKGRTRVKIERLQREGINGGGRAKRNGVYYKYSYITKYGCCVSKGRGSNAQVLGQRCGRRGRK